MEDSEAGKKCCFTGHRPEKLPWGTNERDDRCIALKSWIAQAILDAWNDGYNYFISGMAQGCDLYFCEEVLKFRAVHPEIQLEAAIPYPGQADSWPRDQQIRWKELVQQCDFKRIIQQEYTENCMAQRNLYMVAHSSRIIAVFNDSPGGTKQTLDYAKANNLMVCMIDPNLL